MKGQDYKKARRRLLAPIIVGMIVPIASLIVALFILISFAPQAGSPTQETVDTPQVTPVSATSSSLFFGNAFWGRYINDWSMVSPLKTAYPFSRLHELQREKYDAWFAGLECPTVSGDTMSSAAMDETLSFNCSPDYLDEAEKWFTGFTLANNHTDNRGIEGFEETKRHLDEHGIQYFGHYDPYALDDICDVIALPTTVTYSDTSFKKEYLPVAFCGYHMVFKLAPQGALEVMQAYSKIMPVIAFPHMGKEYQAEPDALKTQTYRALIDNGADVVLGDHPHHVQTTESYKGRLIVYSMGNFMFDQQDSLEVTRSAAVAMVLTTSSSDSSLLASWLEIGRSCASYRDDCLARAQEKELTRLPLTFTFSIVGTNNAQKLVKPATELENTAILERLRWTKTKSELRAPYEAR